MSLYKNILVTGAKGFVGKNLCEKLKGCAEINNLYEYDINSTLDELDKFCSSCDFVFNLAGVNRPERPEEFKTGNVDFLARLLENLKKHGNKAPIMLSSSAQASLAGRFANSEYGVSKLQAEKLLINYALETGTKIFIYRFPNIAGRGCRPNYNSAIATFCNAIANNLEYKVNDRAVNLEVLFIDDLINEMFNLLEGRPNRLLNNFKENFYFGAPVVYNASLGEIVDLIKNFKVLSSPELIKNNLKNNFAKKLYEVYLSYVKS